MLSKHILEQYLIQSDQNGRKIVLTSHLHIDITSPAPETFMKMKNAENQKINIHIFVKILGSGDERS